MTGCAISRFRESHLVVIAEGMSVMDEFAELEKVPLREVWPNEATDFTPWLAANIAKLGNALGLQLEHVEREAPVGDFSLDLLAKDLGSSHTVVIENQLTPTDHDHLGKLLTYAAGFNAGIAIWVAEGIREEHRQALEWLNQRSDPETQFFGVVVEVLRIESSRQALNFKPVVFPNEWRKSNAQTTITVKGEKYRAYFQRMIDELREKHNFTGARVGQPQNWYSFASGISCVTYGANFALGNRARVELYIDSGDYDQNKKLFDVLQKNAEAIGHDLGSVLEWERMDERRASRISISREGSIESPDSELEDIIEWQISHLIDFKRVFTERVKLALVGLE